MRNLSSGNASDTRNGFSLSTCWNVSRHSSGRDMIMEIRDLGFSSVELNYSVTEEMFREILPLVERGDISVGSVHNVFPKTSDGDYSCDSVFLGFKDEVKRRKAVEYTLRSVEFAEMMGAKAVVLHLSQIPVPADFHGRLKIMYSEGGRRTDEYQNVLDDILKFRKEEGRDYFEITRVSLEEICERMEQKNISVVLGLENRSMWHQIPDFQEAARYLNDLENFPVRFWLDIGHAIVQKNLGIIPDYKDIFQLRDRIFGVHIHDVSGIDDHLCPMINGDGDSDFNEFLDIIDTAEVKVFELNDRQSSGNILLSRERLAGRLSAI